MTFLKNLSRIKDHLGLPQPRSLINSDRRDRTAVSWIRLLDLRSDTVPSLPSLCVSHLRPVNCGKSSKLILVDPHLAKSEVVSLNFSEAIRIGLSAAIREKKFITLGSFLDEFFEAAKGIKGLAEASPNHSNFKISDQLSHLSCQESLVAFVLKTWGKIICADKIGSVVTREIGPLKVGCVIRETRLAGLQCCANVNFVHRRQLMMLDAFVFW